MYQLELNGYLPVISAVHFTRANFTPQCAFATHRHNHGFDHIHRCVLSRSEGHKISRRDGREGTNFYDMQLFQSVPGALHTLLWIFIANDIIYSESRGIPCASVQEMQTPGSSVGRA